MTKTKQITHQEVMREALKNSEFNALWRKNETKRKIAMELIANRISRKLTQAALADKVGIKQPSLARIESGSVMPSLYTLDRIAAVFGKTIELKFA